MGLVIWRYRFSHLVVVLFLMAGLGILPAWTQVNPAPDAQSETVQAVPVPENQKPQHEDEAFLELYQAMRSIIDLLAVDAVPTNKEFRYAAAKGLMRALKDPYADFFTPEETTYMDEQMQGSFAGIGATLKPLDETMMQIVEFAPDSPAEKAGLKKGDRIIAIDDVLVNTYSFLIAVMHIRGQDGTEVKLTVWREGADKPLEVRIVRRVIAVPDAHVQKRLEGVMGILTIPQFGSYTDQEFWAAVAELISQGADSFIIDLRGNPGGDLRVCVGIASVWSGGQGVVTRLQQKNGVRDFGFAVTPISLAGKKTAVLINGGSASASEILAGALRDWGAATLIGTTTYGKGVAQSVIPLPDGSSVHVTSAYWLTPKGERIHGKGIKPDIVVELTPGDAKAKKDPQMDRALEFLKTGK